ncbi:MAG: outer membrane beta-barrel protein [Bacteroidia bacterium]
MKRTVFICTLLALVGFVGMNKAMAQEGAKVGFRLSPMVGFQSIVADSTKQKPTGLDTKAGVGFAFDFVFTYGFSDKIALKTGINISKKSVGSFYDFSALGTTVDQKVSLTAVEVPIGLKFRSPEIGSGLYIIGYFGVTPELNFANKVVTTTTIGSLTTTDERRDVDDINLITASFAPGAGVDWEFDWGMLEFSATYNLGLLSYTNKKDTGMSSKISYISLNLGYFF